MKATWCCALAGGAALLACAPAAAESDRQSYPAGFFAAAQPTSAYDMIARLPGFSLQEGDHEVRGLSGTGGNVLVDGKAPSSKQDTLETILRRVPASAVERIELLGAGGSSVDGQGHGQVANVVRARRAAGELRIEGGIGVRARGLTTPALSLEGSRRAGVRLLEFSASARRDYDAGKGRGPKRKMAPSGALRDASTYSEDQAIDLAQTAGGYEQDLAGGHLRLDGSLRREKTSAAIYEVNATRLKLVRERETDEAIEFASRYDRSVGEIWNIDLTGLVRRGRMEGGDRAVVGDETEETRTSATSGESTARFAVRREGAATSLEIGAEGAFNFLDGHADFLVNGRDVRLPAANVRVEETRGEAFVAASWRMRPGVSMEFGSRLEFSRLAQSGDSAMEKPLVFVKPRAALDWRLDPHNRLRFEIDRKVGQLDFEDFVSSASLTSSIVSAGNADLEPDRAWQMTVVWERALSRGGAVTTSLRYASIEDVVDRVPVIGSDFAFDAPGNIGEGWRVEAETNANLPLDAFGLEGALIKADVIWRRSQVDDPTTGAARAISGEPPLEGVIAFTQDLPQRRLKWGAEAILGQSAWIYRFNEVRWDHVETRYRLFMEYRVAPAWTLRLELDNAASGKVERGREQYAGSRRAAPLQGIETRSLYAGPAVTITIAQRVL